MKVLSYRCICPVCREHFTAFMADSEDYQRDEVDASQRALLCVQCERRFINSLHEAMTRELPTHGEFSTFGMRLSALLHEAQRAGEPGPSAQVGTDEPRRVSARLQGMSNGNGNSEVSHRVSGELDSTPETLRGATLLPSDPVGEEGVM